MRILPMWEMGRVHKTICEVQKVSEDKVLQQGVPEECVGIPPSLVCSCDAMRRDTPDLLKRFGFVGGFVLAQRIGIMLSTPS